MALTNYLDPATNSGVILVGNKGGEALQLNADGAYSLMSYVIYFMQVNLAIVLTIVVIMATAGIVMFGIKKGRQKTMKAIK